MLKKGIKFLFGGAVIMHALRSYTEGLANMYGYYADLAEETDEVAKQGIKDSYEFTFIPVAVWRNILKVKKNATRYWKTIKK